VLSGGPDTISHGGAVSKGQFCQLQTLGTVLLPGFDAAVAKLLWPLVSIRLSFSKFVA